MEEDQLLMGCMNKRRKDEKCKTPEWIATFQTRYDILKSHYQEAFQEDLYIDMLGSLNATCDLLLNECIPRNRISFNSLLEYIQSYHTVFIYPQIFDPYCMGKKFSHEEESLNSLKCIVVDIDEVDFDKLQRVIDKIQKASVKPNYVVNSGGGLHLYYIFTEKHNVKASIGMTAYQDYNVYESKCLVHNIPYHSDYEKYLGIYKEIKQGMISWFDDNSMVADHQNHLVQPIRLFGSKTRNPDYYTQIFKITDEKHSIQNIAELFGIELFDEEDIKQWVKYSKSILNKNNYQRAKKKLELEKKVKLESTSAPSKPLINTRFNFDRFKEQILLNDFEHFNAPDQLAMYQYYADQKQKRQSKKSPTKAQAQAIGRLSQYRQFKKMIWDAVEGGKRRDCLFVFWQRAGMYNKDKETLLNDYHEMASYFKTIRHKNKLTDKEIHDITQQDIMGISDIKIKSMIGVDVKFVRLQEQVRENNIERTRVNKEAKRKLIIDIVTRIYTDNPDQSIRGLPELLKAHGIKISFKTLSRMEEIRKLKNLV
jgi:hypothetical protein